MPMLEMILWVGLLIGFVVGIFQSFHFNWFQNHTDENMFKIALILLALMLLLVPPVVRLINQRNIFGAGLLRSVVSALIGWAFWTGGFALFYDVTNAKFFEASFATSPLLISLLLGLLVKIVYFLIPIIVGSIIIYCSGADDTGKNSWTGLVAIFICWFGLCWSFWKLNWFHLHLTTSSVATIPPDALHLVQAIWNFMLMAIGVACALMDFGPVAWIHAIWEGCLGFFQEMFGTD